MTELAYRCIGLGLDQSTCTTALELVKQVRERDLQFLDATIPEPVLILHQFAIPRDQEEGLQQALKRRLSALNDVLVVTLSGCLHFEHEIHWCAEHHEVLWGLVRELRELVNPFQKGCLHPHYLQYLSEALRAEDEKYRTSIRRYGYPFADDASLRPHVLLAETFHATDIAASLPQTTAEITTAHVNLYGVDEKCLHPRRLEYFGFSIPH